MKPFFVEEVEEEGYTCVKAGKNMKYGVQLKRKLSK